MYFQCFKIYVISLGNLHRENYHYTEKLHREGRKTQGISFSKVCENCAATATKKIGCTITTPRCWS